MIISTKHPSPYTFKHVILLNFVGALVVWFLIFMSPVSGGHFIIKDFGDTWLKDVISDFYLSLWTPVWDKLGYVYSLDQGAPFCASNQDPVSAILVCTFYGFAIGIVGASFQLLSMKRRFGTVHQITCYKLWLVWSLFFSTLIVSLLMIIWIDNQGWCMSGSSTILMNYLPFTGLFFAIWGFPLMLLVNVSITHRCWRSETAYWMMDYTNINDAVEKKKRMEASYE